MAVAASSRSHASASSTAAALPLADQPLQALIEEEAKLKLCAGRLLLRIRMASDEVASLKEPEPLFSLTPRLAYLPFLFNDVYEHFQSCLPPKFGQPNYEIWFDYDNIALKWQYPLGVLCDVLIGREVPTPLDLTVHFRCCPTNKVMPFTGIADVQRVFMNAFRQAMYLQHRSATPFMRLQKTAQTQLWDSISKGSLEGDYKEVQQQLLCKNLPSCGSLAVRLHFYGPPHEVLLRPASPLVDGAPRTLRQYLMDQMPILIDSATGELSDGVEVLTHGVQVPVETPLYWLALHAAYLDQFVHLVARVPHHLFHEPDSSN